MLWRVEGDDVYSDDSVRVVASDGRGALWDGWGFVLGPGPGGIGS